MHIHITGQHLLFMGYEKGKGQKGFGRAFKWT